MIATETKATVAPVRLEPPLEPRDSWKEIVEAVEPFLDIVGGRLVDQVKTFEPAIAPYAQYALTNQGKQLRPALVALSAGASGKIHNDLVTVAAIIEMVHLATLVHDDVIDVAQMRRQRPTLAANWGNEVSVLLGDCLFAHALELAASFPTPDICRAVAAATNTVCSGEILQLQQRGNFNLSRGEYFRVLGMKTATLFALSCDLGAALSGAPASQRTALGQYGLALGTAYQVYDDCLDLFGSEAAAGKSLGTDLANGRFTLPILVALERANAADLARLKFLIQSWDRGSLPRVLEYLARYDTLAESRRVIQDYLGSARQRLAGLPRSESRQHLIGLTEFLTQQTDSLGIYTAARL